MASHDARRVAQMNAAAILIRSIYRNWGLFSDYAFAADLLNFTFFVGDFPITVDELNIIGTFIIDSNMIGPDKKIANNAGFAVNKFWPYCDMDIIGNFSIGGV